MNSDGEEHLEVRMQLKKLMKRGKESKEGIGH
jgi:hypothetical protein